MERITKKQWQDIPKDYKNKQNRLCYRHNGQKVNTMKTKFYHESVG